MDSIRHSAMSQLRLRAILFTIAALRSIEAARQPAPYRAKRPASSDRAALAAAQAKRERRMARNRAVLSSAAA